MGYAKNKILELDDAIIDFHIRQFGIIEKAIQKEADKKNLDDHDCHLIGGRGEESCEHPSHQEK